MTLVPFRPRHTTPDGYREPHRVHESWAVTVRTWALVLLALGADLAALNSVLLLLFRGAEWLTAVGSVGLLAAAVLAAHHAGLELARARAGDPIHSRRLRDLAVAAWLGIGVAAATVRVVLPVEGTAGGFGATATQATGPHLRDVLAAALVLALHLAGGVAVMAHTRAHHNPFVAALRRAIREHRAAARGAARAGAADVRARAVLDQQLGEREREETRWRIARDSVVAQARALHEQARVLIATGLQDAPASDALTRDGERPSLDPPRD